MRGPLVKGKSSSERFARLLALFVVFALCALAFQWNIQRQVDRLQMREAIADSTGTLTPEQKSALMEFSRMFQEQFGMEVRIQVDNEQLSPPDPSPTVIFLGLNPAKRRVMLRVPPLAARALGPEAIRQLEQEHFPPYFDEGSWPKGLVLALDSLFGTLLTQSANIP